MEWLLLFLIIFGCLVLTYTYLTFVDTRYVYQRWNSLIAEEVSYQNETDRAFQKIPSLQSAWVCQNPDIKELHRRIFLGHDELLGKIEDYFKTMIECAESLEMGDTPKGDIRYFPFVINRVPTTLNQVLDLSTLHHNVLNLGLLIIEAKASTPWYQSISQGIYRYHYALKLPREGNYGLHLRDDPEVPDKNHRVKWKQKQGFIWDPSIEHYLSNSSEEPCFLLVVDIPRVFSWKYQYINGLLHTHFPPLNF